MRSFSSALHIRSIAAIVAAAAIALPAHAGTNGVQNAAAAAPAKAKASEKKFCIEESLTGSRVAKKVCRTAKEWQAAGIDIKN